MRLQHQTIRRINIYFNKITEIDACQQQNDDEFQLNVNTRVNFVRIIWMIICAIQKIIMLCSLMNKIQLKWMLLSFLFFYFSFLGYQQPFSITNTLHRYVQTQRDIFFHVLQTYILPWNRITDIIKNKTNSFWFVHQNHFDFSLCFCKFSMEITKWKTTTKLKSEQKRKFICWRIYLNFNLFVQLFEFRLNNSVHFNEQL